MTAAVVVSTAAEEQSLSASQLHGLAREALKHTPEKLHWAKGTTFSWVLFSVTGSGLQADLSALIKDELKTKYRVYGREEDLPQGSTRECELGISCYVDGFRFEVVARVLAPETVEVTYSDFEGPLAASSQTVRYRWNGSRWKVLKVGPLVVS